MLKLTPAQRSALRSQAHSLDPVVMIGEAGLTDAVLKEIGSSLDAHGLIKIRVFGDDREERIAIYQQICKQLGAAPVQHIGKLLVVYRPKKEKVREPAEAKGKGLREVRVVQNAPAGAGRKRVDKVVLKGNERITQGGKIKRAKARQTSSKKAALR